MWIQTNQLEPILKHFWYSTRVTESNTHYVMYHDRLNVDVYTLRFNLFSVNFSEENMLSTMIKKVMDRFSEATSVVGMIGYDMLLVNDKDPQDKTWYIFKANSNQRLSANTAETILALNQQQLYLFGQKALNVNVNDLEVDFRDSGVKISAILTIVFSFSTIT